jgi:hypothetical protein
MDDSEIFHHEHFDNAKEFLDYLRPSKPHWQSNGWSSNWLFRGQSNPLDENGKEMWKLLPSAWRNSSLRNYDDILQRQPRLEKIIEEESKNWLQDRYNGELSSIYVENAQKVVRYAFMELLFVNKFVDLANAIGFPSPDWIKWEVPDADFIVSYYARLLIDSSDNNYRWLHPILPLAQHHGISTRLLDWTQNPITSAYFAVLSYNSSGKIDKELTKDIVIYAFHTSSLYSKNNRKIAPIASPNSDNHYQHKQKGILLLNPLADSYYIQHGHFPSFDEVFRTIKIVSDVNNPYRKITLVKSEVQELERLLWLEDISLAHLMPSLDNVARTVKSQLGVD